MSGSPKLKKQVEMELEQLSALLNRHPGLLDRCAITPPNDLEIDALATLLHAFYTGIENIFKRLAVDFDKGPLQGEAWHIQLLESMANPTSTRSAIITEDTRTILRDYLNFRHVFRHAYAHELRWSKMERLVLECTDVLERVKGEVQDFLK